MGSSLVISTWLWGDVYDRFYVNKLASAVARNLRQPYRFVCFTDRPRTFQAGVEQIAIPDIGLTKIKGCLARLRLFDPEWQKQIGITDRLVSIDLDTVVTGPLDDLFDRPEPFTILQGINTTNPNPYNGSVFMLRAGAHPEIWADFSLETINKLSFHAFPDDQGWFWHKAPGAAAYGPETGIYGFKKLGWPKGDALPANALIVAFPGWRDPQKFAHLDWVRENWQ
jgi:hypothetical protein